MVRRDRETAAQLHERWSDETDLARMSSLLDLREFLLQCVIRSDYVISDALNASIVLSEYGDWLQRELGKKKVPTKEARLLCFLEFYHLDVLVDVQRMDPEKVADAIGDELLKQRIYLPFITGPDLYRKAAELFPDEKYRLGNFDTMRLLDGMPIGVFQLGKWISGPYGIIAARQGRGFAPTLVVPLQHCHDVACRRIHSVQLETDTSAAINEHRSAAAKILEAESDESSDFGIFFADVFREDDKTYNDFHTGTLPLLLGDCLSTEELRTLLTRLVEDDSLIRESVAQEGLSGNAKTFVEELERAQLLQLCLLGTDDQIVKTIDALVEAGAIQIPVGEVRRPVLFRSASTGAFHARLELSEHGVRADAAGGLAPLRLRRLVDEIYDQSNAQSVDELAWQLREVPGLTLAAQLDEFLRTASPRQAVSDLVLTSRSASEVAARRLNIDADSAEKLTRPALMDRILWKLGFTVVAPESLPERFWELHEELTQSARSASVSTTVNEEAIRGLSANYFEQLERVLSDSLAFAAWVLTNDHVTAESPFHYDDDACRSAGLATLQNSSSNVDGPDRTPLNFSDKTTLYGLCRGFAILSEHLRALRDEAEAELRDIDQFPRYAAHTTLKKFPFRHRSPFLDLIDGSQDRILEVLTEVSRALVDAKVSDVRNSQVHYRRAASDLRPLIDGLEATRGAVRALEDLGFVRILFAPSRIETDEWDRTTAYLTDGRGREVVLGRPSEFTWLNLPAISSPQYLVVAAQFAEPNEVLRVTLGVPSDFTELWHGIPSRRQDSGHVRRSRNLDSAALAQDVPVASGTA